MKKSITFMIIICTLFIFSGCGGGGSGGKDGRESSKVSKVNIDVKFKINNAIVMTPKATSIKKIRYTVTGPSMEVITGVEPVVGNLVVISLLVLNGPQRMFVIEALDALDTVIYEGSATMDLTGSPVTIEIILEKVIGVTAPTGLNAIAVSSGQIDLSWNPITGNIQISGYKINRNNAEVMTVTGTSASDTGLSPNTNYCYTVTAFNSKGQSQHSNQACATTFNETIVDTIPPSIPANLKATAVSGTEIFLSWDPSSDNIALAGYKVYDSQGNFLKSVTANSASFPELEQITQYCYTVSAFDTSGNESGRSSQSCAITLDATPPSVPANLQATAVSLTQIDLSWNASTDNIAVAGYKVYDSVGALLGSFTATSTSFTGLAPITNYCFSVSAFDTSGNESGRSSQSCAKTLDATPPSLPVNLQATAVSSTQIDISWDPSADNVAVAGYKVYDSVGTLLRSVTGTSTSFTGLAPNTNYCFSVSAFDTSGNESVKSNQVCATTLTGVIIDTIPPSVPINLQAAPVSFTQLNLSWDPSADNVAVAGYKVYDSVGTLLRSVTGTSASFTGLTINTNYCFKVSAFDTSGNESAQSSQVCATTLADTASPSPPTSLGLTFISSDQINLAWGASTDNVGVTGYKIYRDGTHIVTVAAISTVYSDTELNPDLQYCYQVTAIDAANNESGFSNQACGTTLCVTGTWASTDLPSISMTLNQSGSTVSGSWVNANTGCSYNGSGSYNRNTHVLNITFVDNMNPLQCCQSFTYSGTVSNCKNMSLNWTNNCSYSGGRQY